VRLVEVFFHGVDIKCVGVVDTYIYIYIYQLRNMSCVGTHWGQLNKFSNMFSGAEILKVFFRGTFRLGIQYYVRSRSRTLWLARVKYWDHSTQLFTHDELTGEFSDLSLYSILIN